MVLQEEMVEAEERDCRCSMMTSEAVAILDTVTFTYQNNAEEY
jgi:hypothetical protein